MTARPRVAVIGAGISGIGMAIRLLEAGYECRVFEKADAIGGTWRDNRYPGLTCDVPAFVYTYSFDREPGWSSLLAPGAEIQRYVEGVFDRHGLAEHTQLGTEITSAEWGDDDRWHLTSPAGDEGAFDVLVHASGFLHHPRRPEIAGLETFTGEVLHSARWDDAVEVRGRRIGIIGTGSTGVQLTAALAGVAQHVTVFQRTPQWIFPFPNPRVPARLQRLLASRPKLLAAAVERFEQAGDWFIGTASIRPGIQRRLFQAGCRWNLRRVKDRALRARLEPVGEPFCKRPVMSRHFYDAVQRDDVSVVTAPIGCVEPGGVRTDDGVLHALDVLVLATGFDAHAYMRPMRVAGVDGRTIDEAWADGPRAYNTMALPGFPNMFLLLGPHAPLLSIAIHTSVEHQAAYILQLLETIERDEIAWVAPTAAATDAWLEDIRAAMTTTVWATDCRSWYLDERGFPIMWPFDRKRWFDLLAKPDLADYEIAERQTA